MHEMEEGVRSGGVLKKKSSSGCLIIKKKGDVSGNAVGSSHQGKKRPRLQMSDSGSSDDSSEHVRRKVNEHVHNGPPVVYSRRSEEERELRRNGEFMSSLKLNNFDLYEFDEYDEFDVKRLRNDYSQMLSGSSRDFGGGSSRSAMVEKRKQAYFDSAGGGMSGRNKVIDRSGKRRSDFEEDETHMPISMLKMKYQDDSTEPIRLQGKNGVLKVMVNKKKKMDLSSRKNYDRQEYEHRKGSRSEDVIKKDASASFYSDSRRAGKRIAVAERDNSQLKVQKQFLGKSKKAGDSGSEKNELTMQKLLLNKNSKAGDYDSDDADTALKLGPPSVEAGSSRKAVKHEAKRLSTPDYVTPVKGKEKKVVAPADNVTPLKGGEGKLKQRAGSTEKQQLRERIREMLMKAGWTIDYRPRRNRDYLDAVYISPSGTAYWSIIKAYEALQKQWREDDEGKPDLSSSFAPLSDDLINKLTRQTRKKIEEEMKRKRKNVAAMKKSKKASVKESADDTDSDQNDERLSSFIRQNGKPKKSKLHESINERVDDLNDHSDQDNVQKPSTTSSSVVQGRKSRVIGRCTLLIRNSELGQNSESDGYIPYTGKRTLLSWLIDSGTVQLSEKVQYMNRRRTQVKLEGWITKDGIHCGCCSKILTVSKFELHAGSKLRQPFQNIFLESGPSLLQCLIDAWNRQEESVRRDFHEVDVDGDDPDDDTCGICGDGGDLICCDGCPSTFHLNCLGIQVLPPGDWHCPNCTCKFCGTSGNPTIEDSSASELSLCIRCEKKYHKSCSGWMLTSDVNGNDPSVSFCGKKCQELHDRLHKILGVKHELEAGFSWSLLQRTDLECDASSKGFPQRVESNSKLAVALSVMDECFLPIIDRRSKVNLIHNVLYNCGSNFSRLNFCGFFTMVLERGDELISAASIRIRGPQLAEMPFIGTRNIYRRQGMCRRLLSAIETVLCSLKVEQLVIPAISEHMHTWTAVFGFKQLQQSDQKGMKSMNMLVFPGTDLLQKQLLKQEPNDAIKGSDSRDNLCLSPAPIEKTEAESPIEQKEENACKVESDCNYEDKASVHASSPLTTTNDSTEDSGPDTALKPGTQLSGENTPVNSELIKDNGGSPGSSIESSALDSSAKSDTLSSADNLTDDAHKMNIDVSNPSSNLEVPGEMSKDTVEDVGVDQDPVCVSNDCRADENSMLNKNDQDSTLVEIPKIQHSPVQEVSLHDGRDSSAEDCDGVVPDGVPNNGIPESGPSSVEVTVTANGFETVCIEQNPATDILPSYDEDSTTVVYSNLNKPVGIAAGKDLPVSAETVGDAKVANDLTCNSAYLDEVIPTVGNVNNDTGTDVKACHSENAHESVNGVASGNGLEEVRKLDIGSDFESGVDHEVTPTKTSLTSENRAAMENGLPIASGSCGAEIAPLNEEVDSLSKHTSVDNSAVILSNSLAKKSAELEDTLDANTEPSGHLSPQLSNQSKTTGSEVIGTETVVQLEKVADMAPNSS
ncbi:OLC1v1020048C1 [Oldenlandia corymbosa var. corymbosa]|uniref:OLC1v1020048C1 n=1 Tax=Oldenlandia corymbosa var. corymbosa TaxID=529605 RepID=A0AAV1EFW0_OLDCO|nr:OLC1v1020048C1 [Oldenlandia corymbosa var. corymbosa]